jgi:hypothetical protein
MATGGAAVGVGFASSSSSRSSSSSSSSGEVYQHADDEMVDRAAQGLAEAFGT